jgi:hypothetical protein
MYYDIGKSAGNKAAKTRRVSRQKKEQLSFQKMLLFGVGNARSPI